MIHIDKINDIIKLHNGLEIASSPIDRGNILILLLIMVDSFQRVQKTPLLQIKHIGQ